MGVYVVTGGSGGIGGKTVEILRSQGHETINVDLKGGDINANIATKEGRQDVIDKIHELHPEGIDGLICVAGVAGTCGDMKLMFSLNYFGVTGLAYSIYDLLKKKGGSCVVIVSNTISQGGVHMDLCDMLNYACNQDRNEARILSILEQYDGSNMTMAQGLYATTKYALARWCGASPPAGAPTACASTRWLPATSGRLSPPPWATALRRRWRDFPFPSTIRPTTSCSTPWTSPMCWCFWCPRRPTASTATSCS